MKNPFLVAGRCFQTWRALRHYPGVFSPTDASRQLRQVVQPQRITNWELQRFISGELQIRDLAEGCHEIQIKRNGLIFYWTGDISEGLASGVLQELDPEHSHYYTTPPVSLTSTSIVLDVGACEGLFALRVTKDGQAAKVHCFEPSARTAALLRRAAEKNGVANSIALEICAVGRDSREVYFTDLPIAEANHIVATGGNGATKIRQVSLDDYCQEKGIKLRPIDLIKVDAEGADLDVIKGAERSIREGSPQIAVTTYHNPGHAVQLIEFLRSIQPNYALRLKGFTLWNTKDLPRPVLLQAALREKLRNPQPASPE